MQTIIAIVNRNGGVGKTTCAFSLAGSFARMGKRVCVLDLDPQADLTNSFMGAPWTNRLPIEQNAACLFDEALFVSAEQVIVKTEFENLWLLPGSELLEKHDGPDTSKCGDRQFVLRDFLSGLDFDLVLIDCPPNCYFLSWSALCAADYALVPTRADPKGVESIQYVNRKIEAVKASVNPALSLLGYVLGDHKKKNPIHVGYAAMLKDDFGRLVFEDFLPHSSVVVAARHKKKPIAFHSAKCEAARACQRIVEEIERRIEVANPMLKEAA